jgi:hypothetical protein
MEMCTGMEILLAVNENYLETNFVYIWVILYDSYYLKNDIFKIFVKFPFICNIVILYFGLI